ncbi:MAG: HK97 family phage prohead protease [Chloroflexota bacterium]
MQRRFLSRPADPIQLRENPGAPLPTITGYAAVFFDPADPGTEFRIWGKTYERIMPAAFNNALARGDDARALFNHDTNHVLGRRSAGTLRLIVDARGLKYEIDPPDTATGRGLVESIRRRDITGSSFAFIPTAEMDKREGDRDIIEVHDCELFDVGPVVFPAYAGTEAGVRGETGEDGARKRWEKRRGAADRDRIEIELLLIDHGGEG